MTKPIFIFDLDGTIALNDHRAHLVRREKPDWNAFFKLCVDDVPNYAVINTLHQLRKTCEIWIWSGRSDIVREETIEWLMRHNVIDFRQHRFWYRQPKRFMMRPDGDHRPDEKLKEEWLHSLSAYERVKLTGVFDDRPKVIRMWRNNGIFCFDCGSGEEF